MTKILTDKEVKHIAHLARIKVSEADIEKYKVQLGILMEEVDKIREVTNNDEEILISPITHESLLREDENKPSLTEEEIMKNAPSKEGNFIKVPVMINE